MTRSDYFKLLVQSATDGTFPGMKNNNCQYRGENGTRCAVGILIPDSLYRPAWDNCDLLADQLPPAVLATIIPEGLRYSDLADVQQCHDNAARGGKWNAEAFLRVIQMLPCFADVD